MYFVSPNKGWVVNSTGQIWHTEDGGTSWEMQAQLSGYIRSIEFADSLHGWAGTLGFDVPILFRTQDGGRTWTPYQILPNGSPPRICGISVASDSVIYACGAFDGPAVILKSEDAGESWQAMDLRAQAGTLIDVHFFSPDTGIVVGGAPFQQITDLAKLHAVVLTTTDGGASWQVRHAGTNDGQWGWKIFFRNRQDGYVSMESGAMGMILRTADGGLSWTEQIVANNRRLQAIGFFDENLGWVGGHNVSSVTTDGGNTWQTTKLSDLPQSDGLNRFLAFGDSLMYASGRKILKYSRDNVTSVADEAVPQLPESLLLLENHPNPFNPSTTISYTLPRRAPVRIRIYNALGQTVRHLFDGVQNTGEKSILWDGVDDHGQIQSSGLYIYRVDAGKLAESNTMLLVK